MASLKPKLFCSVAVKARRISQAGTRWSGSDPRRVRLRYNNCYQWPSRTGRATPPHQQNLLDVAFVTFRLPSYRCPKRETIKAHGKTVKLWREYWLPHVRETTIIPNSLPDHTHLITTPAFPHVTSFQIPYPIPPNTSMKPMITRATINLNFR